MIPFINAVLLVVSRINGEKRESMFSDDLVCVLNRRMMQKTVFWVAAADLLPAAAW